MSIERSLPVFLALVLLTWLPAGAVDELATEATFTIPGLESDIVTLDMADADGDNAAEILATDNHRLVLYSPSHDEVWLNLDIDSFYAANAYDNCDQIDDIYEETSYSVPMAAQCVRVLLADVNRDSNVDALMVNLNLCQDVGFRYLITFIDDVSSSNEAMIAFERSYSTYLGIGAFDAVDWDDDGYNELIFSADSVWSKWEISMFWYVEVTAGLTFVYESFPDIQTEILGDVIVSPCDLTPFGLPGSIAASRLIHSYEDQPGPFTWEYTTGTLALIRDTGLEPGLFPITPPYLCNDNYRTTRSVREVGCVGDISGQSAAPEILTPYFWSWHCSNDDYSNPEIVDSSGSLLILSRVVETDSVVDLWSVDITGHEYQSYFYHPDYPGSFFAVEADTLFKFDGSDGSVARRFETLPTGLHIWDYPYAPDRPYLLTVEGATVTYQSFDMATGVDEPSHPDILPVSFVLGRPYPNPFNPTVTMALNMSTRGHLRVEVFNSLGQRVDVVYDRETDAGELTLSWDGSRFSAPPPEKNPARSRLCC